MEKEYERVEDIVAVSKCYVFSFLLILKNQEITHHVK